MARFGLIGFPVAGSLSPELFRKAYGGRYPYDLVEEPDFDAAMNAFINNYDAVNVTSPFKVQAFERAGWRSREAALCGAANILVKDGGLVRAYNSDVLAVKEIIGPLRSSCKSVAVIGSGGAGRAAIAAAQSLEFRTFLFHHDNLDEGAEADIIIYTLPRPAENTGPLRCRYLLEANYKSPCLAERSDSGDKDSPIYIPGTEWLRLQAVTGYGIMTGETPDL